jgi:hypothetical protein
MTANADHELFRNLLLNTNASYENDAYQGISRTDHVYGVGGGLKYFVNRNLYIAASYNFQERSSTGLSTGIPYRQSIFFLRASTQF